MDLGYQATGGGGAEFRVYHQQGFVPGPGQTSDDAPLVDGPRGFCLDITNLSGKNLRVRLLNQGVEVLNGIAGHGSPVTNGQARSRTVAEVNAAGFSRRGDVSLSME